MQQEKYTPQVEQKIEFRQQTPQEVLKLFRQILIKDKQSYFIYDILRIKAESLKYLKSQQPLTKYIKSLPNQYFEFKYFMNLSKDSLIMINHITGINWINLTQLILDDCQIVSIEGLTYIQTPILTNLQLVNNKIVSIKSLQKTNFRQMDQLKLKRNPFNFDKNSLGRMKFKLMRSFSISHKQQWTICENIYGNLIKMK